MALKGHQMETLPNLPAQPGTQNPLPTHLGITAAHLVSPASQKFFKLLVQWMGLCLKLSWAPHRKRNLQDLGRVSQSLVGAVPAMAGVALDGFYVPIQNSRIFGLPKTCPWGQAPTSTKLHREDFWLFLIPTSSKRAQP